MYLLVLEKAGCRPRIYIGSGTNDAEDVRGSFYCYCAGNMLPRYVEKSVKEGYSIEHMGLLCWIDLPSPGLVLKTRLFLAVEAAFAYTFWAMRTVNQANDYGMGHICPWDRSTLEYDGLCSHCCLYETILGDYELSEKELEELNEKRKADLAEWRSEYRAMRMANDPEQYLGMAAERMRELRVADPEHYRKQDRKRKREIVKSKEFYCELCKVALDGEHALEKHNRSVKHLKKEEYLAKPHVCTLQLGLRQGGQLQPASQVSPRFQDGG